MRFICCVTGDGANVTCSSYRTDPVRSVNGAMRLVTPSVSRLASQHFNCRRYEVFGAVLESVV
jgi:hypothetical protein